MKLRILVVLGVLIPLALFGARKTKPAWEQAWQEGMELYKEGRYADAVPKFEAVVRILPGRSSGHAMLGKCRFNLEDYARALEHFREAHRLAPEDGDAVCRLVTAHVALRQYPEALGVLRSFDPTLIPPESRSDCFRAAGMAALALQDLGGAAAYFIQARDAVEPGRPSDLQAWLVKSLIQGARQEKGEAQTALYARAYPEAEALATADPSPESHLLAAEAALAGGNFTAAEAHARGVLAARADDPYGTLYWGQALCGLERFAEAVGPLERAGALLPGEGQRVAWNQWGYAWERLGDRAKALEGYARAGNEDKMRKLNEPAVP